MKTGRTYGQKGLIPIKRFVSLGEGRDLPYKAHDGTIQGLLEPEPQSWTANTEFPNLWRYLMGDVLREPEVILLSFEMLPTDEAYVVERAHVERELYSKSEPTRQRMDAAFRKYWKSRVTVPDYDGSYSIPQLTIWSPIEFERLNIEWKKPSEEFWENSIKVPTSFSRPAIC